MTITFKDVSVKGAAKGSVREVENLIVEGDDKQTGKNLTNAYQSLKAATKETSVTVLRRGNRILIAKDDKAAEAVKSEIKSEGKGRKADPSVAAAITF